MRIPYDEKPEDDDVAVTASCDPQFPDVDAAAEPRQRRRQEATRRLDTDTACDPFRSILPRLVTRRNLRVFAFILGLTGFALVGSQAPAAQSVAVKLATVVPEGSIWDKNLKQMGDGVEAGDRRPRVGHGVRRRLAGRRGDRLRKMRLDALQAASFTASASARSTRRSTCSTCRSSSVVRRAERRDREAHADVSKQRLDAKGFVLLNWGHGGWTQVFTKRPVQTVADLKSDQAVHVGRRRSHDAVVQGERLRAARDGDDRHH